MATLGEQAVGSVVKLNVDGTPWKFIVVHQGLPGTMYDSSCDGTWLLMEDVYEERQWDGSDNDYANSDIHAYLNSTFLNLFDNGIKAVIKQAKLPYTKGNGKGSVASGSSGISAQLFLLSYTELDYTGATAVNTEGAALGYFLGASADKKVGYYNGASTYYWFRSPLKGSEGSVYHTYFRGGVRSSEYTKIRGVRPALILPYELNVADNGLVDGTIASAGAITGTVPINGVQRELTGEGYINIGGVLRELSDSQVNIGGTLKSLKG